MDFLEKILTHKQNEVSGRMQTLSYDAICQQAANAPPPRNFYHQIKNAPKNNLYPVIAEIKKKSPSKGLLCHSFNPAAIANTYATYKAACLSVLTDEKFFGGKNEDLIAARESGLPVLRKDFMINRWHIAESRAIGADAILLIVAAHTEDTLQQLAHEASQWQLTVLVEAHSKQELDIALKIPDALIGINNRNLKTFETDLQTTLNLLPTVPDERLIISESGIKTRADILRLQQAGVGGFLIGEAAMQAPETALQALFEN